MVLSVVPQDVLQMIRRVRYVKDVQIYTWLPFKQRLGDTTQEKRITDFYSLKNRLQPMLIGSVKTL